MTSHAGQMPLKVMTILVRHRMFGSPAWCGRRRRDVLQVRWRKLRSYQQEALDWLDTSGVEISTDVLVGDSPLEAMDREQWEPTDLLVVASAGGGLLRRVFLGDTTFKILRVARADLGVAAPPRGLAPEVGTLHCYCWPRTPLRHQRPCRRGPQPGRARRS